MELTRGPSLALTYKNDQNEDGAGAQLQRIYGIYAISRFLAVPYIHTPIRNIDYQGLLALENNAPIPGLLSEYNRVFHIPSDIDLPQRHGIRDMVDADADSIEAITKRRSGGTEFTLIRIAYPYPITDRNPELYQCVKAISPFRYRRSDVFRLAIHVRRGELFAHNSDRMLPNAYYVSCALNFQEVLRRLDIAFICELYTEVASKKFEVTPHHHGIRGRVSGTVTLDPAMNHLEDFEGIPRLEHFINTHPIETLRRMATADGLIISRSSFSYLSAILSTDCVVIYHPFLHFPMKDWLITDANGNIPENRLFARLEAWKNTASRGIGLKLTGRAKTPIHKIVGQEREAIFRLAAAHGAIQARVIGSVARDDGHFESDIHLLVMWRDGSNVSGPAALASDLESLLERKVDVASHDGSEHSAANAYYRDIVRPGILRTEPVLRTIDQACELHVMTCRNDWLDLIWTLKSFYHFSNRRYALCIHDDGTVPALGIEQIRRMFPEARLVLRKDADARAEIELRDFPRCKEFRRAHMLAPKVFDFTAFLENERMLSFDSDLLFFKEPTALLEKIEDRLYRKNIFNADCENGYTVEPSAVREEIGHELLPLINSGLGLVHKGSLRADWCEEFLSLPCITGGPFWWNEEQTLIALCSSRFGAELLPEEYTLYLGPGVGNRPFRHYINRIRQQLMYSEGIRALAQQRFLPWEFVVLAESERL